MFAHNFLFRKPRTLEWAILIGIAFVIRFFVFATYLSQEERYCQADSMDYHNCACCITHGFGMTFPNGKPIFWRTPGYPAYISLFYSPHHKSAGFTDHYAEHYKAIIIQIVMCALLPYFVYTLSFILTGSYLVSALTAGVSIFHPGFILASGYLLTDALAQLFFVLFMCCFFASFSLFGEPRPYAYSSSLLLCAAALLLAMYTWMRPMGQFIAFFSLFLLLFSKNKWRSKLKEGTLFMLLFLAALSPWFFRNYKLTGNVFFCPLFGLYLNVFNAPKILSRITPLTLKEAHQKLTYEAAQLTRKEIESYKQLGKKQIVCGELICLQTALPLILRHPLYFLYDWMTEVIKTTFDLYASQLVSLEHNCFKWDPLVEFLPEKIQDCLYKKELPWFLRFIAFLEFAFSLWIWVGILAGIWAFFIQAWWCKTSCLYQQALWIKTLFLIGALVIQTGGFGYARLRLPIEPLIIMLGIYYWFFRYPMRDPDWNIYTRPGVQPISKRNKQRTFARSA